MGIVKSLWRTTDKKIMRFLSNSFSRFKLVPSLLSILLLLSSPLFAEPWINAEQLSLRADIETLADIGIIKVPITTYPLMWSGIIKDLDNANIEEIKLPFKSVYWRVKLAGKNAITTSPKRKLKLSASNSEQILRSFGDSSRGKGELTASSANLSKNFAWKAQVTSVVSPFDGDHFNYDGSYVAGILGNWIFTLGSVDKWWGASWDSSNILSNNARPPAGISVTRNYSESSDVFLFNWLGPWSVTGFTSKLENTTNFEAPLLSGLSFSAKPLNDLEVSFRATSMNGGTTLNNLINSEPKVIKAFDFRWRIPNLNGSLYASVTDEEQSGEFASNLIGFSSNLIFRGNPWRYYLETSKTYGNRFNRTYEDDVYSDGYRIYHRSIGSTYDNDSEVTTLGVIGNLNRHQSLAFKLQRLDINQQEITANIDSLHSVNSKEVKAVRFVADWKWQYNRNDNINLSLDMSDKKIDGFGRQQDKYRIAIGWTRFL